MDRIREIGFEQPWMLLLLFVLPAIWVLSFNSLAGLGRYRRLSAIAFRSVVYTFLVFALAEIQWRDITNRLTVIYILDQSESIPREQREAMLSYVAQSVKQHRREGKTSGDGDMAGVIVFGANAKIEAAPYEGNLPIVGQIESGKDLKVDSTNLEAALRLAKAAFPENTARRIVVVTDGNQNIGDALAFAPSLTGDGIGIDIVPVKLSNQSDVSVEKLLLPSEIRKGQRFEARVVLTNENVPTDANPTGNVSGILKLTKDNGPFEVLVAEQEVELRPGKNVIAFDHQLDQADIVTFDATFIPDHAEDDAVIKNNQASAFAHVRGKGRVLLIEDAGAKGEFVQLVERLQAASIEVDLMATDAMFTSAAELLQYDSIILANVARASDDATGNTFAFTDGQIQMMVNNCRELGCGIVMIGGDRSFGAGGWANTELEKAMPVDFQIKNDKISAVGALAMVMHASEMADGNFWQIKIAKEALNILGPMDYCGIVDWSDIGGSPRWLWKLPKGIDQVTTNRNRMLAQLGRMTPGDMPDFAGPMELALAGLKACPASMKHMIIISDGDPAPPPNNLLQRFNDAKIKITTVGVGTHGVPEMTLLRDIANKTGGKYYEVKDPRALPKIYQREARRVAKPVVKESKSGMRAIPTSAAGRQEMLQGIDVGGLPPFFGYVMTTVKKNALVEQLIVANDPADNIENTTLLAAWRYELGRTVVFTSDAGHHWTSEWFNSEYYDKFFSQIVRYSMRPVTQSANFTVGTDYRDNKVRVVVTAMNETDDFINFLNFNARGVAPNAPADSAGFDINFVQTAPGRYEAEFDSIEQGFHLISILPGEGYERLTTGISVPYSNEYSDRETNDALLKSLASIRAKGAQEAGTIASYLGDKTEIVEPLKLNPFRPDLKHISAIQSMWPTVLIIGAWVFLTDVFIRRVAIGFEWVPAIIRYVRNRLTGRQDNVAASNIERLRSKKSEISRQLEAKKSEMRFEPIVETPAKSGKDQLTRVLESERDREVEPPLPKPVQDLEKKEDRPHTSRLLDIKRKSRGDRPNQNDG